MPEVSGLARSADAAVEQANGLTTGTSAKGSDTDCGGLLSVRLSVPTKLSMRPGGSSEGGSSEGGVENRLPLNACWADTSPFQSYDDQGRLT